MRSRCAWLICIARFVACLQFYWLLCGLHLCTCWCTACFETGEVCWHPPVAGLEVAVVAATMTWRWSLSALAPSISHPQSFSSHSRQTLALKAKVLRLAIKCEARHWSPWQGSHLVTRSSTRVWDAGLITTEMVTLAGSRHSTRVVYGDDLGWNGLHCFSLLLRKRVKLQQ